MIYIEEDGKMYDFTIDSLDENGYCCSDLDEIDAFVVHIKEHGDKNYFDSVMEDCMYCNDNAQDVNPFIEYSEIPQSIGRFQCNATCMICDVDNNAY